MSNPVLDVAERRNLLEVLGRIRQTQEEAEDYAQQHPPTEPPELAELNRTIADARWLSETNPNFSAARSFAVHVPVLPLAPGELTPLVKLSEACQGNTADGLRTLLDWYSQWPAAGCATLTGPLSNIVAIRFTDAEALREYCTVIMEDEEEDVRYSELLPLGGGRITHTMPGKTSARSITGWGKKHDQRANEFLENLAPETLATWLGFSYPAAREIDGRRMGAAELAGLEFPAQKIADGVDVLGPGDILPLHAQFADGSKIVAQLQPSRDELPAWLARRIGKPHGMAARIKHATQRATPTKKGSSNGWGG
jgi:hypothetical protein